MPFKYLIVFFLSMIPILELRFAVPFAVSMDLPYLPSLIVCILGNMLPVPVIYLFARKVLIWGSHRKHIGSFCQKFLEKGEKAGRKIVAATGKGGTFLALMLFVGIPLPGTGAWTGTLGASFLDMGFKSTVLSVSLGVVIAGIIMALGTTGIFAVFG